MKLLAIFACVAATVFAGFAGTQGIGAVDADVFWLLRAPRIVLALVAGAGLAAGGVASQALMLNPLADPYVLGVSGGAALAAVLVSLVPDLPAWGMVAAAIAGAAAASTLVFVGGKRLNVTTLLLCGVVFNAFAAAVITLVKTVVSAQKAQEILFWLMGELTVYDFRYICAATCVTLVALGVLFKEARHMDVLVQGDDVAQTLGVDPARTRFAVYAALTAIVGAVVALTGLIGFVGLIVPHLVRARLGPRHAPLLLCSALFGAALLVAADACCRIGFQWVATELPVGVLTSFIGAPYFIWVLRKA